MKWRRTMALENVSAVSIFGISLVFAHVYMVESELTMAEKRATPARRTEEAVNFMFLEREGGCCVYEVSWGVKG